MFEDPEENVDGAGEDDWIVANGATFDEVALRTGAEVFVGVATVAVFATLTFGAGVDTCFAPALFALNRELIEGDVAILFLLYNKN